MTYVLLNTFEPSLDKPTRVLATDETIEGLIEYIEEAEDLEGPLADELGWWVERDHPDTSPRGPFSGGPVVLRAGVDGASGWYEIVQVGA